MKLEVRDLKAKLLPAGTTVFAKIGVEMINIKPTDLQPAATYEVHSVDTGILGTATGAALMTDGIDVLESPNSAAHILIIMARQ